MTQKFSCKARQLTGTGQVRSGGAVEDVVLFLAGVSDSEVDDGPVRGWIIVLSVPDCTLDISDRRFSPDSFKGLYLVNTFVPSALLPPSRFR